MLNRLKLVITCVLTVVIAVPPAFAGRFFRAHRGSDCAPAYYSYSCGPVACGYYYGPSYDACGATNYCGGFDGCSHAMSHCYGYYVGYKRHHDCGLGDCCGSCDAVGGSITSEVVVESEYVAPQRSPVDEPDHSVVAPEPPRPATVDRPVESEPAPQLPPPAEETFAPEPTRPLEPPAPPADAEPTPPADDLFDAAEEAPSTDATPAEAPPAQMPADETNDLFGAPPAEPAAPPETPAETGEAADDLFGAPADTPTDAPQPADSATEEPSDDLFGAPADEPADASSDSLFGTPAESEAEMPAEEPPAEEAPADEPADDVDDIFGATRQILQEAGGLASEELRTWVDNSGNYSCRARMLKFAEGQVRLMKENGRTTTVPLYRLSASDLQFVYRQASAIQAEVFQTAQR